MISLNRVHKHPKPAAIGFLHRRLSELLWAAYGQERLRSVLQLTPYLQLYSRLQLTQGEFEPNEEF